MRKNKKMNGTLYSLPSASLTHLRKPEMPAEQREKLLAMHKASRANAGIYVAVVLAVYVILLTILLCRYARRQRLMDDVGSDEEHGSGLLQFSSRKLRRLKALLCCYQSSSSDHPLTRLEPTEGSRLGASTVTQVGDQHTAV